LSLSDSKAFDFQLTDISKQSALFESSERTARAVAKRLGGIFKVARICGTSLEDLFDCLPLPDEPKFNWTISSYECAYDVFEETSLGVREFLKSKSLGKSRFVKPTLETSSTDHEAGTDRIQVSEVMLKELYKNVLTGEGKRVKGLDIVVSGGFAKGNLFGYTVETSETSGFQERDFSRSYQDPTVTMGPRLARTLVNLATQSRGTMTLLDPFCGLGTILQEAMMCGYSAAGVDISNSNVEKTKANLRWLHRKYQLSSRVAYSVLRADSTRLTREDLPPIDAVATEPILIPKYDRNPTRSEAETDVNSARSRYVESLRNFARILKPGSRVSIVTPEVIDERGRTHGMKFSDITDLGFSVYRPAFPQFSNFEYPVRVPTTKKKIVQRNVYVMTVR
jgi:tRNA G10  N-methylase Trm11